MTSIHFAVMNNSLELVSILLACHDIDLSIKSKENENVFELAKKLNYEDILAVFEKVNLENTKISPQISSSNSSEEDNKTNEVTLNRSFREDSSNL